MKKELERPSRYPTAEEYVQLIHFSLNLAHFSFFFSNSTLIMLFTGSLRHTSANQEMRSYQWFESWTVLCTEKSSTRWTVAPTVLMWWVPVSGIIIVKYNFHPLIIEGNHRLLGCCSLQYRCQWDGPPACTHNRRDCPVQEQERIRIRAQGTHRLQGMGQ